jgi:signal transduction histidine kinase
MNSLRITILICIGITVILSFATWVAWLTDMLWLASLSESYIPMAPLTATCFLLVAAGLITYYSSHKHHWVVLIVIALLGLFSINVLLTVAGIPGFALEDGLVPDESAPMFGLVPMGRMSPITAYLFLLCCFSLLLLTRREKWSRIGSGIFSVLAFTSTLIVLVGYLYNTPLLYGQTTIPIALTTGIGFLALSLALMIANGTNSFPLLLFYGEKTYARLLRGFLPLTAFLVLSSGAFQIYLRNRFFTNEALIISTVAIGAMVLVTLVTIYLSRFISAQIDRVEAEKRRLLSIIEATLDLVMIYNVYGAPLYLNKSLFNLLQLQPNHSLNAMNIKNLFSVESRIAFEQTGMPIARKEGAWKGEGTLVLPDGRELEISHIILYHEGTNKEDGYYSSVMRDISALKAYQHKIEVVNKQLQAKNDEVEEFVYAVSHDLSEPLRMVTGFLQLTEKKLHNTLDKDTRQYMDFALGGAKRMDAMLKDLLELSRTGTQRTEFVSCNLNIILKEAVENLGPVIEQSNAVVTVQPNLPEIQGHHSNLMRLFQNLIGNAIKYRGNKTPEVKIAGADLGQHYQISVHDNGIGIAPEFHQDIFKVFKRLHTAKEYSGSGIGLAVCKKIVELHGGKIWVDSEKDKGSIFYIRLPKYSNSNLRGLKP